MVAAAKFCYLFSFAVGSIFVVFSLDAPAGSLHRGAHVNFGVFFCWLLRDKYGSLCGNLNTAVEPIAIFRRASLVTFSLSAISF